MSKGIYRGPGGSMN